MLGFALMEERDELLRVNRHESFCTIDVLKQSRA